jgi:hypothetical protein
VKHISTDSDAGFIMNFGYGAGRRLEAGDGKFPKVVLLNPAVISSQRAGLVGWRIVPSEAFCRWAGSGHDNEHNICMVKQRRKPDKQ